MTSDSHVGDTLDGLRQRAEAAEDKVKELEKQVKHLEDALCNATDCTPQQCDLCMRVEEERDELRERAEAAEKCVAELEELLRKQDFIIRNVMTDSQLDTRCVTGSGKTLRQYIAECDRLLKRSRCPNCRCLLNTEDLTGQEREVRLPMSGGVLKGQCRVCGHDSNFPDTGGMCTLIYCTHYNNCHYTPTPDSSFRPSIIPEPWKGRPKAQCQDHDWPKGKCSNCGTVWGLHKDMDHCSMCDTDDEV